jgi:putative endonuclease
MWQVYLVECADKTLYCGVSADLDRRLRQHAGRIAGGARYTRGRGPVRLVAAVSRPDRTSALRLEAAVKRARRADKLRVLLGALFSS